MAVPKKYGFETTAAEIAAEYNLEGKNVIVTGGYSGIGLETTRVLAKSGAHVFVVGRDLTKGEKVAEELRNETEITAMRADLSSFASIRQFAEAFNALHIPLHLLINNAGVMACPKGTTTDGFETQFGTNFLGHFLLTELLIPRLIEGAPSRVIIVASSGHLWGGMKWDDINSEKCYDSMVAYGQSKTANILHTVELNRRYKDQGVIANTLHPGYVKSTDLARHSHVMAIVKNLPKVLKSAVKYSSSEKTIAQGAATTVYAALSPDAAAGGQFYDDCHESKAASYACDPAEAEKLWVAAEKWVGIKSA